MQWSSRPATCPLENSYEDILRILRASCKIHRTRRILTVFAGRSGRRSGRRGPELGDAEYLIDRECHHAEHEVAFDLDRAAHAHGPCAEFILQSGVDAFGQGAKIKMTSSGSGIWMSFMRSTSLAHSALASCWTRKLRSMIGAWPSALLWSWMAAAS